MFAWVRAFIKKLQGSIYARTNPGGGLPYKMFAIATIVKQL